MYQAFALLSEHYKQSRDGLSMVLKQSKKDFGETGIYNAKPWFPSLQKPAWIELSAQYSGTVAVILCAC